MIEQEVYVKEAQSVTDPCRRSGGAWHPFEAPWNEFHPAGCDSLSRGSSARVFICALDDADSKDCCKVKF